MNDLVGDVPKTTSRTKRKRGNSDGMSIGDHKIEYASKKGDCVLCSKRKRVQGKEIGQRTRTNFKCMQSNEYLCRNICFSKYHDVKNE